MKITATTTLNELALALASRTLNLSTKVDRRGFEVTLTGAPGGHEHCWWAIGRTWVAEAELLHDAIYSAMRQYDDNAKLQAIR